MFRAPGCCLHGYLLGTLADGGMNWEAMFLHMHLCHSAAHHHGCVACRKKAARAGSCARLSSTPQVKMSCVPCGCCVCCALQVKEVLLSQAEVYEVEVREEQHRRPGDVRSHDALKQDMLEEVRVEGVWYGFTLAVLVLYGQQGARHRVSHTGHATVCNPVLRYVGT